MGMRIDTLSARLRALEQNSGYITLPDGTRFKPVYSGILLLISEAKLRRDLGREPVLSDFPEEDQEQLRCYAKWHPDPGEHGQISVLLAGMGRKLCD